MAEQIEDKVLKGLRLKDHTFKVVEVFERLGISFEQFAYLLDRDFFAPELPFQPNESTISYIDPVMGECGFRIGQPAIYSDAGVRKMAFLAGLVNNKAIWLNMCNNNYTPKHMGKWKEGMNVPYLSFVQMNNKVYQCINPEGTTNPPVCIYRTDSKDALTYNDGGYVLTGDENTAEYVVFVSKDDLGLDYIESLIVDINRQSTLIKEQSERISRLESIIETLTTNEK